MNTINNVLLSIVNGVKSIDFGSFVSIEIFLLLIYILINNFYKMIESLLGIEHKIYFYDLITLGVFICLNIYIYYLLGKHN